ncbi:TPA: hypothetical protein ACFRG8_000972 [Neisseria lactamica]
MPSEIPSFSQLSSFPRRRESRNPTLQKFIRNNNNLFIVIPAKAGI